MSIINEGGVSETREILPLEPLNLYCIVEELLLEAPKRVVIDEEFATPLVWPFSLKNSKVEVEPICVVAEPVMIPKANRSPVLVGVSL